MKKLMIPLAVCAAFVSGWANGASTNYWFNGEDTLLSDNSAEKLINADGGNDTIVSIGDTLTGIFNINSNEGLTSGDTNAITSGQGYDELSGIFSITVTNKVADGAGGWKFTFGANTAFESTYGSGAVVAFYTDPNYDYSRLNDTLANLQGNVTDGTLFMVAGFDGGGNEFWTASALTDDIAVIAGIPLPGNGGEFNAALDLLVNNTGHEFTAVSCFDPNSLSSTTTDLCGSGSLLGTGGANTPFDSFDNVDFVMHAVPEPNMILLLGSGFLLGGLGIVRRRMKT